MKKFIEWILKILAQRTIKKYKPGIVGITGSVGKTSAKDAIYAALGGSRKIRASRGNFNGEIGLPLTILGEWRESEQNLLSREHPPHENKFKKALFLLKVILVGILRLIFGPRSGYPEILILEYGADRPGDIKYLLTIAKPQISVITAVGRTPVHVGYYSGPEEVLREKSRLIDNLPQGGLAVLNVDDELVMSLVYRIRGRVMTFGFSDDAEMMITGFENRFDKEKPPGISFKLEYQGDSTPINIDNSLGRAAAYAIAAAACLGVVFGMNLARVAESMMFYRPPPHRMRIIKGIKDSIVVDDSYNASPLSMSLAIDTVKSLSAKRKVGILGDMLELGGYSVRAHEEVGRAAGKAFDVLVVVGPHAKFIAEQAEKQGMSKKNIFEFDNADEAVTQTENLIRKDDLVLIKASRGIGLDKVAEVLKKA